MPRRGLGPLCFFPGISFMLILNVGLDGDFYMFFASFQSSTEELVLFDCTGCAQSQSLPVEVTSID